MGFDSVRAHELNVTHICKFVIKSIAKPLRPVNDQSLDSVSFTVAFTFSVPHHCAARAPHGRSYLQTSFTPHYKHNLLYDVSAGRM